MEINRTVTIAEIGLPHLMDVLRGFGICEDISRWHLLTDWQEKRGDACALRIVAEVDLTNGERRIIRFLNERQFILDVSRLVLTTWTIERQCAFSEILRRNGMVVPRRYLSDGHYCMDYCLNGFPCDATVESWLENTQPRFRTDMFAPLGHLIGQIHRISEQEHCHIGFSIVYDEVEKGAMDFRRLFTGTDTAQLPAGKFERLRLLHDEKKAEISALWPLLPRSAVQGDIYSCNNVAWQADGTPGFYDFNIAADEVLLGDMLHAWFRTVYDPPYEAERQTWDYSLCWNQYLEGYTSARPLTEIEQKCLPQVYALLGAIYASRYTAKLLRQGKTAEAIQGLSSALDYLEYPSKEA